MASPHREKKEPVFEESNTKDVMQSASTSHSEQSLSSINSNDECFRSSQHAETSLSRMETYLLKHQLTDITLIAGTRQIPAHRLVLSAGSEYFSAMFTSNLRESTQSEVVMKDVDGDALWNLVHYCYTGRIELREETVETLLGTACLLQLREVVDACCCFLKKQLHPSNCIGICQFADRQGCVTLRTAAHSYTTEHFMEVIRNQEFMVLPVDEVAKLFASDDLNVPSEELIFHALMSWVYHDVNKRKEGISRLLALVKLPLLPASFIADFIETETLFREDRKCQELIMEAMKYHLLPERRPLLQSSRTRPRKSTVGLLYAVGGMDANKAGATSIEQYDLRANKWSHVANMSGRRLQFGVAVVEGKLYVVGGRDGLKTLNSVECFDLKTKTWSNLPPMSTHRHGLGVGILEGPLYAVGGHDGWSYLNTVERWDPQVRQWSYVAPMSTQRSTVGVAVLNTKLYAVGGRDGSSCLRTVECYDPHTNKWTACAPMTKRRGGVGVGVMNGYLYALGGHDVPATNPSAARFDCVERYDPKTDTWTTVACMSIGRDAIGVSRLGDRLIAVGGYDGQSYLQLVEAYDSQNNEWQQVNAAGKGILITGCDSRVGYGIARQLDDLGFTVFAGFQSKTDLSTKLKDESSGRLHVLQLDITSEDQIQEGLQYIKVHLPQGLWALINNVSWAAFGEVEWVPFEVFRQAAEINLLSAIRVTQIFLPLLRKTKGRVVNILSIRGRISSPVKSPFCTVKFGLEAFSECLRLEMRKWGVDVIVVEPGTATTGCWFNNKEILEQAKVMWKGLSDEIKNDYGEDYFEYKIRTMPEYNTPSDTDITAVLRSLVDAVSRTFPLTRYTPVTRQEKIQALVADHLPRSVYDIIYT